MAQQSRTYQDHDGIKRTMHWDDTNPDAFGIHTQVTYDRLVENNAALAELVPARQTNRHVARVPLTIYEQSIRESWDENDWKRWLNDPDNAAFRIWKGRV